MVDNLNQLFIIILLIIGVGAFIVKAVLNIKEVQRTSKRAGQLNWRIESIRSFTILWNIIVIIGMVFILLIILLRVVIK